MVFQALAATVVRPVMAALVVPVLMVMPLHPMVALAATAVEPAARVSVVRADWEPRMVLTVPQATVAMAVVAETEPVPSALEA